MKEIERTFLVKQVPDLREVHTYILVTQGYIALEPNEVRVRKEEDAVYTVKHYLTVKSKGNIEREETPPVVLTKEEFNILWLYTEGRRLRKIRYKLPYQDGKHIIELNEYLDCLRGLFLAEIEFGSVKEAKEFVIPDWLGIEVTYKSEFKNSNLAKLSNRDVIPLIILTK